MASVGGEGSRGAVSLEGRPFQKFRCRNGPGGGWGLGGGRLEMEAGATPVLGKGLLPGNEGEGWSPRRRLRV